MTTTDPSKRSIHAPTWLKRALGILVAVAGGVGTLLLLLVLAGVFQPKVASESVTPDATDASDREFAEVRLIRRPRTETAVGTVEPVHEAAVASKLLARVVEVNVTAGQAVSQGDVLVRLEDADLQARLKQAEAALTSAEAQHERAQQDYDRAERLIGQRTISQQEHDAAVAALRTADAELTRTQEAVQEAKVLLGFATLHSPLTGVVIDKRVEPGDTATPGQVLVTLYEPNRMQLVATVRESLALRLAVGDRIPARLESLNHECLATISEIVPEAEAASRSFTVKVTGPCPPGIYSGMFGRITIPLDEEEIVVVPTTAVKHVGQLALVEVLQDGRAYRRSVQLGRELSEGYEVLAGLEPGEQVVIAEQVASLEER
jgi:RND family efflux transporter MFP subunit